jgi:hypothetical protein
MCDCGTCCNGCGHDDNCMTNEAETDDPSDHYGY